MGDSFDLFKSQGGQVRVILTTLFASVFTFRTLYAITSQRELLITIFLMLASYIVVFQVFVSNFIFYEESADFYKLVIKVANEDKERMLAKERKYANERKDRKNHGDKSTDLSMYINSDADLIIQLDYNGKEDVVYLNRENKVKTALVDFCIFLIGVLTTVIFFILIDVYTSILDSTVTLEWYNYIIVFVIPIFLIFVFMIFKRY
jgi:hypothetical protein